MLFAFFLWFWLCHLNGRWVEVISRCLLMAELSELQNARSFSITFEMVNFINKLS